VAAAGAETNEKKQAGRQAGRLCSQLPGTRSREWLASVQLSVSGSIVVIFTDLKQYKFS
jgi:hypothetical protein